MHKEPCNYGDYFHPGQRARVEMPLRGEGVFKDGAVVTAVADNEIGLRLSRDQLPENAALNPDTPLVIRIGGGGNGYTCRGVVVHERPGEELRVALIDRVMSEDTREYYRLSTDLPVALFNMTSGVAEEHGAVAGNGSTAAQLPRIGDISGGGMRTETAMAMAVGDMVYVMFQLPLAQPKSVPAVAQVVHAEVLERARGPIVTAGLKFVHINERDRDAIIHYVCNEEIKRIRVRNNRYSF